MMYVKLWSTIIGRDIENFNLPAITRADIQYEIMYFSM